MKLKFKIQAYQTKAVEAVVDCFQGQPNQKGQNYRIDPGKDKNLANAEIEGFKNSDLVISPRQILENIQKVQRRQNLQQSPELVKTKISDINLDTEMETGTGKTYCYIKTIFEMNKRFGWSKFIIVVPSIAIREGVKKSFEITGDHFLEMYGKRARFFIYNSKQLHNLESFSSESNINVMIINVQAFNARGKDNRRIYEELDDFQSRRPIDVIKANRPIMILDEPQKMEGDKTLDSLKEFAPLMILRYSATHKTRHNKIFRLDALDAYNQKLVKKISVRGISVKGLSGANAYLFLESIEVSQKNPTARMEIEIKQNNGIKRVMRKLKVRDNLFELADGLDQYKGYVISEINANEAKVSFTNGVELIAGEAIGDVNESMLRRIQIREAIKAHLAKEQVLFHQGIKVLSLFFIDEVAKYRVYSDNAEEQGEYARIFEEEYIACKNELGLLDKPDYMKYLNGIPVTRTHNGYFSIDKKTKRMIDPTTGKKSEEADDVDAYDLILKDKERLLSFTEPVRFIFSHSALREGWDNPNVFVICTLKHSDNTVSRRQEVGRGLRLSVNQFGERQDSPATVHQTNVLTVIANESYKDFVTALQQDICASLSARPRIADEKYFSGKCIVADGETMEITPALAKQIYRYLVKNDYTDANDHISQSYHKAVKQGILAPLPEELQPYQQQIFELIDSVFSEKALPAVENDRTSLVNPRNDNFNKKEFKELWQKINRKAAYSVHFDSNELIDKCVKTLELELKIKPLQYLTEEGIQQDELDFDAVKSGKSFKVKDHSTELNWGSVHSTVSYDLIGKIVEGTELTRRTVAEILSRMNVAIFAMFKTNPEHFISETTRLINEQKATVIIEHLTYDKMADSYELDIFTDAQIKQEPENAGQPLQRHIYDYVVTDSKVERKFVEDLDSSSEVVVYAKLPRGFFIPTPVGNYNPDWAIAFKEGVVKHIYFVAETKGSMSTMQLKSIEQCKIACARKFFAGITSDQVKYDVIDNYETLLQLVK